MKKKDEEIGLTEIAALLGVSRQTAYVAVKSGEVAGGRLVAGKLWVATRGEAMKAARKRKREAELRREAAAHNPLFAATEVIREGITALGATLGELGSGLT